MLITDSSNSLARQLRALPAVAERAVIINCSTKMVTTLALMSVLRYAQMPVLVIDCESVDGSADWLDKLSRRFAFDLVHAPLRPHGRTLDRLFAATLDESLLLIDSDLEILQPDLLPALRAGMAGEKAYGAGFLHRSEIMASSTDTNTNGSRTAGRYMERMWIPCAFLKVAPIVQALGAGATFMHSRDYLEFPWSKLVSKILFARNRVPVLRDLPMPSFNEARLRRFGEWVPFREFDTGARVHQSLVCAGYALTDLGEPYLSQSVRHYHGVTRATLNAKQKNAASPGAINAEVEERLQTLYGLSPS